jgi:hypothetical protein
MTGAWAERGVIRVVASLPPFFISYAHTGERSNAAAEKFYHQLREELQPLVAPPVGTYMGFFDVVGLPTGVRWPDELAHALGTCQVLVALLSVPYLKSEWCGKEWYAFTERKAERVPEADIPEHQSPIIPVRWARIPFKLPPSIGEEVQIFRPNNSREHPDLAERYDHEGLYGLLSRGDEEGFKDAVLDLASYIQRIYYGQELLPKPFKPEDLRNVFEGVVP